jgi:Uma2 family endonuclease
VGNAILKEVVQQIRRKIENKRLGDRMEQEKLYSIDEISRMEGHVEMVNGKVVITNSTTPLHNDIIGEIANALRNFAKLNGGECKVYTENVALFCNEISEDCNGQFFLPDVMLVCDKGKIDQKGVHGTPDFVVEVTSPATRDNDYNTKRDVYKKIGVKEYWIVDLKNNIVVQYMLESNYEPEYYLHPKELNVGVYDNRLQIDLSEYLSAN